jgi:serine/threonine protein kinase
MGETELISKGSYGCVYKPGIKCNVEDKIDKKIITKVQLLNKTALKEMKISDKIINKIHNYKHNYAPIISSCEVDMKEISNEVKDCEVLKEGDHFILNKLNYAGNTTLIQMLFNIKKKSNKLFLRHYFNSYLKLFDSIKKLNDIGIIHLDIKGNNIIYSNLHSNPIIIDFGLSLDLQLVEKQKKDVFFVYGYDYIPWCIDLALITHIVTQEIENETITDLTIKQLYKVCDDFTTNNLSISNNKRASFNQQLKLYIDDYNGKTFKDLYDTLLTYSNTWDIHSLMVMYHFFLADAFNTNNDNDNDNNNINIKDIPKELLELFKIQETYLAYTPSQRISYEDVRTSIQSQYQTIMPLINTASNKLKNIKISSDSIIYKQTKNSYKQLKIET